jgi:hypothetical protein
MPAQDRLRAAFEEMARLRKEFPGMTEADLPPEARDRFSAAARAIRAGNRSVGPLIAVMVLLVVGAGAAFVAPVTCYSCGAVKEASVSCAVTERPLGFVARRTHLLRAVASASGSARAQSEQSTDSSGKRSTVKFTVQDLRIADAAGATLHETSQSYLLGTGLPSLAERIDGLARGASRAPIVACVVPWPPLLLATLFGAIGLATLVSQARPYWVPRPIEWLLDVAILVVALTPWAIVLLGTALPGWLVELLRLGPPT